ncbi:hypothetical protein LWI28_021485 [Acer negundo]|uniref:CAAX prenyl protease 2/Lysostaphin resistance protein A-like domain-containing protein n=1 Tax=Acer negundo TaxID=4023 RepID=A0AAD5J907_ACENE|nr:hypothetical protein LWI28_021485 [Acer negundo]
MSTLSRLSLLRTPKETRDSTQLASLSTASTIHKWRYACFRREDSSSEGVFEVGDGFLEEFAKLESDNSNVLRRDWGSVADSVFGAEPWTVPWTAMTILQVMFLWIASFYLVGSWIIPFIAHAAGFRKESLTYRGQALYSLLTDVAEDSLWRKVAFRCRFGMPHVPLVNRLSQVNLNLIPILPSTPVTVSSVEQSIVARDPVAMVLYAVVVSVCAPIWEEIVFRGFLLPSLTKYMPVWCSILVSSVAFALAHLICRGCYPLCSLGW